MIRFEPHPKPDGFAGHVERPGAKWLAANTSGRPPSYWRRFSSHLADAFRSLCAYSAMYEPVGTVDHFVSCDEDRMGAYDWTNFRYASSWLNASKRDLRSDQIPDPFVVENEWFQLLLPSMQLVLTARVPPEWRARAELMLSRLHLGHDERVIRQRREWYRMFQDGELDLEGLAKKAPLIAMAVKKQGAE